MEKKLIRFLTDHGVIYRFQAYLCLDSNLSLDRYILLESRKSYFDANDLIANAFCWDQTDEGQEFWEEIDKLWRQ